MPIGPQLPPVKPEKRKRDNDDDSSSDEDTTGPALPDSKPPSSPKRARVVGPTLPPAPLEEKPPDEPREANSSGNESSDDDDDYGPSLPTEADLNRPPPSETAANLGNTLNSQSAAQSKRDEWMTAPPPDGDWSSRIDPTKLKNRKFNTGKSAKGPSSPGGSEAWHETPAEKQARLQREVLGLKSDKPSKQATHPQSSEDSRNSETARRLQEFNKHRGPSLYNAHQQGKKKDEDDDPSARAFDREKDIGGGLQINATQRRDMMKKASDFSSRFSSAKYL